MKKTVLFSKNIKDFEEIVRNFVFDFLEEEKKEKLTFAKVIALSGDLGVGKTTFVQVVGKILKIKRKINSPTFVIMKKYSLGKAPSGVGHPTGQSLIHIDAYRLKNEKELLYLGWQEIIKNPENLIFIEWSENVKKAMPKKYIKINIEHTKEGYRKFVISKN